MNVIIHGYFVSVILTKFKINANLALAKFLHFEFWFWHSFWFFAIYKSLPGDKLSLLRTAKSAEQNTIEFPTVSKRRASHLFATKAGKPAWNQDLNLPQKVSFQHLYRNSWFLGILLTRLCTQWVLLSCSDERRH